MKLSRKLIPAFIMLLVSAVLMSTASFAWFSTNTSATVSGMKVKIATATTLLIKDADTSGAVYATSMQYSLANDSMAPLSTATPENTTDGTIAVPKFYKLAAANGIEPGSHAFKPSSTFAEDKVVESGDKVSYLTETILLRGTGDGTTLGKLALKVGVSENSTTDINASLRIMFAVKDPDNNTVTWFRCSPFGGTEIQPIATIQDDGTVKEENLGTKESLSKEMVDDDENAKGAEVLAAVKPESEYTVTFYIWFEGQDPSCFANNAVGLKEVGLTFTFSLV